MSDKLTLKAVPISSLERIFYDTDAEKIRMASFSGMRNEPINFQVAYQLENTVDPQHLRVHTGVEVISDIPVSLYSIKGVPLSPINDIGSDEPFHELHPDILIPKKTNPEFVFSTFFNSYFVD